MPVLSADAITQSVCAVFAARGVRPPEARIVAEHLVEAEASGVTSHGLIRVPQYAKSLEEGTIQPAAKLRLLSESPSAAAFDGGQGFGQVLARGAMDKAIEIAARNGAGAVTLTNCGHTGRLGSYTEFAARQGFAALMMVNAGGLGQWVAPFGGVAGRLSTNPLSIGVPTGADDPLVLDMATSQAPEGRIRTAFTAGRSIPEGWIINHQGQPTTNPADLYGPPRGAILPFGGYKGFGLGLMIDALAGGLSGAGCCHDPAASTAGITDGVFFFAVSVGALVPEADFQRRIRELIAHMKSSPPAPGVDAVLVPGELEFRTRRERMQTGIPVADNVWQTIEQLAAAPK